MDRLQSRDHFLVGHLGGRDENTFSVFKAKEGSLYA